MKSLKPSHRERKRYLLIKGKDANKKNIDEIILDYIGVLGYGKASPQVVMKDSGSLILAVNREKLNEIRASFLVSGKDIQIVKVSGSVKGVR